MKKFGILFMLLFTLTVSAQSDFEIAQSFMNKKGVKLAPNKRSTTRGTDVPYSVFNGENDKGFAIVVNGSVVGYDINNTINEDNMPCCLKEMLLESYSKSIKPSKTRGLSEGNVKAIKPIIKTKWNQCSPYYDSISQKTNLCFFVAKAQMLHYYRVNFYIERHFLYSNKPVDLYPTTFDHDLIDREGDEGWAEETARFFKYAKHGVTDTYSYYTYEEVFSINERTIYFDGNTSRYQIYNKILEMGKPMLVSSPNHAFIIDGRDKDGRYHVNFGWGGAWDGYYFFPDTKNDKQNINSGFEYNKETNYWASYYTPLNETASITPVTYKQHDNAVYNLQGTKVGNSLEGLPKGIYIQGGKKVIK